MAQAQPNPQVNAMCANIAAQIVSLRDSDAMPNVQAAHEEIQKITTTLGDLNHVVISWISPEIPSFMQDGCPVCQAQGFDFRPGPQCGARSCFSA